MSEDVHNFMDWIGQLTELIFLTSFTIVCATVCICLFFLSIALVKKTLNYMIDVE